MTKKNNSNFEHTKQRSNGANTRYMHLKISSILLSHCIHVSSWYRLCCVDSISFWLVTHWLSLFPSDWFLSHSNFMKWITFSPNLTMVAHHTENNSNGDGDSRKTSQKNNSHTKSLLNHSIYLMQLWSSCFKSNNQWQLQQGLKYLNTIFATWKTDIVLYISIFRYMCIHCYHYQVFHTCLPFSLGSVFNVFFRYFEVFHSLMIVVQTAKQYQQHIFIANCKH